MPSTGRSLEILSRIIDAPSTAFKPCMHEANAPTPGTTRPLASKATERSDVITTSMPEVANAR